MSIATDEQKKLKAFIQRRHPEYEEMIEHWKFLQSCYDGGRAWFKDNIFQYIKEGDKEYAKRIERAYRFNHTREVVDLVDKHLFKQEVARSEGAPESIIQFWKSATVSGLSIRDFMRQVSREGSILGRPWIVVDNRKSDEVLSVEEAKKSNAGPYAYIVGPKDVLDMGYDEFWQLNWILIREQVRDDEDPIESSGALRDRYRLWTREDWTLFNVEGSGKNIKIIKDGPYYHGLGVVPVIAADHITSDELYTSSAMIDDVAYLDRAVTNYLSNLDAIIQDQTFSQLAMPAQAVVAGEEAQGKLMEMGTSRLFTFNGENGQVPFYLSPDVKQAELIMAAINKIIGEIYHTVGLAGERTKDDNSQGIDNSSGVAKAYDFERVNSLLAAKADSLETIENKIIEIVSLWTGDKIPANTRLVEYPDNFDTRGLYDEFEIAARLALIEAPKAVRREQMEMLIDKLFPKIKKELRDKMVAELKSWPVDVVDPATGNPIKKEGKNSLANKLVKT
jgi:hypothetical protein